MLPNHAPLIVAETFGTLATLFPGRIDLGLGRAPGTDPLTARALRWNLKTTGHDFPELVEELQSYFKPEHPDQKIRAVPGTGVEVPIWILGSSLFSADYAANKGLPYVFAAHFAPADLIVALEIYRARFKPSATLKKPYVMVCIPVVAAPSDSEAQYLATSVQQKILGLIRRNYPPSTPEPVEDMDSLWSPPEKEAVQNFLREMIVGGPETLRTQLSAFQNRTNCDEIMIHTDLYRIQDTLRSFEILSQIQF